MKLSAQNQNSLHITSSPFENYGFITWVDENEEADYFRLEVHELNWESGDTLSSIAKRFEIWDRCFAKVPNAYLGEPDPYTQYRLVLRGFDSNHNPIPNVQARLDGPPATKGCYWDCESSDFAYRIQQYDNPNGGWNYRIEMAYETEDEDLNLKIPYLRWFSNTEFNEHIGLNNNSGVPPGPSTWHNYWSWNPQFINSVGGHTGLNSTSLPHLMVVQQNMTTAPNYWNNLGHAIYSPTVKGIRKGFGQWFTVFAPVVPQVIGFATDFCESNPDLATMRQFMTNQLNIDPALTCPPNLGGGGTIGGGFNEDPPVPPGGFNVIKYWAKEFIKEKPPGGGSNNGGGSSGLFLDDEIIFFDADNWMERISEVFAYGEPGSVEERFTSILSESELFALERFGRERTVILNGNFSTFFNIDGTPIFPTLNLTEGMYRLTVKKKGHAVFFIAFEVREAFDMQVQLKDYFEALLFPNPHTNNDVRANITTTAALKVNYSLFDNMGNLLYTRNFNLPKNHSGQHSLNFDGHLPNGFLYHKFTFEDGSYKTYPTLKQ